jgi:hypothetical protein
MKQGTVPNDAAVRKGVKPTPQPSVKNSPLLQQLKAVMTKVPRPMDGAPPQVTKRSPSTPPPSYKPQWPQ